MKVRPAGFLRRGFASAAFSAAGAAYRRFATGKTLAQAEFISAEQVDPSGPHSAVPNGKADAMLWQGIC